MPPHLIAARAVVRRDGAERVRGGDHQVAVDGWGAALAVAVAGRVPEQVAGRGVDGEHVAGGAVVARGRDVGDAVDDARARHEVVGRARDPPGLVTGRRVQRDQLAGVAVADDDDAAADRRAGVDEHPRRRSDQSSAPVSAFEREHGVGAVVGRTGDGVHDAVEDSRCTVDGEPVRGRHGPLDRAGRGIQREEAAVDAAAGVDGAVDDRGDVRGGRRRLGASRPARRSPRRARSAGRRRCRCRPARQQ